MNNLFSDTREKLTPFQLRTMRSKFAMIKSTGVIDDTFEKDLSLERDFFFRGGIIYRNRDISFDPMSLTSVFLMSYPIQLRGTVDVWVKDYEKKPSPVIVTTSDKPRELSLIEPVGKVRPEDQAFLLIEPRRIEEVQTKVVKAGNKDGVLLVETWNGVPHDILECEGEAVVNKPFRYRRDLLSRKYRGKITQSSKEFNYGYYINRDIPYYHRKSIRELVPIGHERVRIIGNQVYYRGSGAAGDEYREGSPLPDGVFQEPGNYCLNSNREVVGKSPWIMHPRDIKKQAKFIPGLIVVVPKIVYNWYQFFREGDIIGVGYRMAVFMLLHRFCIGQIMNVGARVILDIGIADDRFLEVESKLNNLPYRIDHRSSYSVRQKSRDVERDEHNTTDCFLSVLEQVPFSRKKPQFLKILVDGIERDILDRS